MPDECAAWGWLCKLYQIFSYPRIFGARGAEQQLIDTYTQVQALDAHSLLGDHHGHTSCVTS